MTPESLDEKIDQITKAETEIEASKTIIEREVGQESEIYKKVAPSFKSVAENLNKAKLELKELKPVLNALEEIKKYILQPVIDQIKATTVSGIRATAKWALLSVLLAVVLIPIQNLFKLYLYSYCAPTPVFSYSITPATEKQVASLSKIIGFQLPKNLTEVKINPIYLSISPNRGKIKRIWISVPEDFLRLEMYESIKTPVFLVYHGDAIATPSKLVFEVQMSPSMIETGRAHDKGNLLLNYFQFINTTNQSNLPMRVIAEIEIHPQDFGWYFSLFGKFTVIYHSDFVCNLTLANHNRISLTKAQVIY